MSYFKLHPMIRLRWKGFVELLMIAFFLVCCYTLFVVPVSQGVQTIAVDTRNAILPGLHVLIQQALHIANTSTSLYKFSRHNETRTDLQIFLECLVTVSDDEIGALSPYSNSSAGTACDKVRSTPLADPWDTSLLCRHLIGMKILIVGSHMTYRLHDTLLDILPAGSQGSQFRCHSPVLCTWHEICSPAFPRPHVQPASSERRRMPPQDLSNSAILRFSMSSTLFNVPHEEPFVSPLTGVREHNTQDWFEKARHSDMIILSKRPVPAPAWSYLSPNVSDTRRFNVKVPSPGSPEWNRMEPFTSMLVPQVLRDSGVVQAAWRATIVKWLPELIETLIGLRTEKVGMEGRLLVWLGSRFVTGCAGEQEKHDKQTRIPWIQECAGCKDRYIFENVQVYIQNLLLQQILPPLGVLYLPAATPSPGMIDNATKIDRAEDVFLDGLMAILRGG